jgi:uncharacterized membrane protein YdfJ with MMPL/SSD domain
VVDELLDDDRPGSRHRLRLFIVSRYREEREDGKNAEEAMASTLDTAGKAVFLSALTVVLSSQPSSWCP